MRAAWTLNEVVRAHGGEPESPPLATSIRSVLSEGVLEWTLARRRAAGRADHVDEGAQRGRDLPMPGIIEEQSFKRWRPVFQNADQLARAQERLGQSLACVRDPQPVNGRANCPIGIVDHHSPVHRNPPRFAVALEQPHQYLAVGLPPIFNADVTGEIIGACAAGAAAQKKSAPQLPRSSSPADTGVVGGLFCGLKG